MTNLEQKLTISTVILSDNTHTGRKLCFSSFVNHNGDINGRLYVYINTNSLNPKITLMTKSVSLAMEEYNSLNEPSEAHATHAIAGAIS